DAEGALAGDIRRLLPRLLELYDAVAVAPSPPTAAAIRRVLGHAGVDAGAPRTKTRGPLYRRCLRAALALAPTHVHYLDFDRALHWVSSAPEELRAVVRLARRHHGLVLVGRTERAHRSHQRPLYATELVVNRLLATRLGYDGRVDFLVPSFVVTGALAERMLRRSRARGGDIYGEWAAVLATLGVPLAYLECRGLEWETPDRARRTVRRLGLAAWRARFDTPAEWALRTTLARDILRGFERALVTAPRPAALRRLRPRASG